VARRAPHRGAAIVHQSNLARRARLGRVSPRVSSSTARGSEEEILAAAGKDAQETTRSESPPSWSSKSNPPSRTISRRSPRRALVDRLFRD
jgi:hypothetical protein